MAAREQIGKIITIMERDDALQLSNEETTYEPDDEVFEVDWDSLFPKTKRTEGELDQIGGLELPGELVEKFWEIAERGTIANEPVFAGYPASERNQERGHWDICAWYQPIHYFGHDFGIFIREDCLVNQALAMAPVIQRSGKLHPMQLASSSLRASFLAYFLHEQFHHKVESFAIRSHVLGKPVYLDYKSGVYRPTLMSRDCLEEALANADSYNRLGESTYKDKLGSPATKATRRYLKRAFRGDPPGYNRAGEFFATKFSPGLCRLQGQIWEALLKPVKPAEDWLSAPHVIRGLFSLTSEIYSVVSPGAKRILPTSHISPKTYSTRDATRALGSWGYKEVPGGKGSHIKMKRPGSPTVIIPGNRKALSPGVLKSFQHAVNARSLEEVFSAR